MREDGLYIDGVNVGSVDYSLTFQGNDLTKPDERKASGSNSFSVADTLAMRELMQGGEQPDSFGKNPYITKPAQLIENGEVIFSGLAEFERFQAGWLVNLLDALVGFWDQITDKKLNDLDLSSLDHKWNLASINSFAGSTTGIVYPLVDGGTLDAAILPYDTITPAVYLREVVGKIVEEAGFIGVGEWLKDWRYNHIVMPFVGAEPTAYSEDWVNDRTSRVSVQGREIGRTADHIVNYTRDNDLAAGWYDGKLNCFDTVKNAYVCPQDMRVRVQAFQSFNVTVITGAVEARLSVEKNGIKVGEIYWDSGGGLYNGFGLKRDSLDLDVWVTCKKDDELRIRFYFDKRTIICAYTVSLSETEQTTWASFIPDSKVSFGDVWPVARNLPDLTCNELLISIAKMMSATFNVDDKKRTVELVLLNRVKENIASAVDWSALTDESIEPELIVKFEGYGQTNLLKWKEQSIKENIGYGDGKIPCNVSNLPLSETLFELPFSAVLQSDKNIAGYGRPLLIETRSVSRTGTDTNVSSKEAVPCFVLVEPLAPVTIKTKVFDLDGITLVDTDVTLTASWWAIRPNLAVRSDNNFALSFSPVIGQTEESLIESYFDTLQGVLRRPRLFNIQIYPSPTDVATLDLSKPILLKRVRVGSLDFNFGYYYLNKLANYRSNVSCPATLIAL